MTTSITPALVVDPDVTEKKRGFGRGSKTEEAQESGQKRAGWPVRIVLFVICALWLVPTIGTIITSFRPGDDANSTGWWTAYKTLGHFTFSNYSDLFNGNLDFGSAFANSFAISLPATVIPILVAAFAAYAFTFMTFPGREFLFVMIVSLLVVPNQVAFLPLLKIYGSLGLSGTFAAVWIFHAAFAMPLAIYILRNYMMTLPREVIESAKIDGATHFQTFWKLIVPMSTPALASFAIFQFLWVWNDLLVALIFIGPGPNQPLPVAVSALAGGQNQGKWNQVTSAGCLMLLVPLVVFLLLQRFFVRGLTAGAVKG